MKILVAEKIAQKGIDTLVEAGMNVDVKLSLPREELLDIIKNYDAIVVRSVTKIDEEFYEHATNLKVVGRAGNGVDNIQMDGATKRGVIVVNTPDANTVSAAEHSIGLLLASGRNIPQANALLKNREWDRSKFTGVELLGKTVGVVGLGRIGSLVATRLQSFGMKVIAYDPYITDERFKRFGVEKRDTLEELVKESDFITVHTPKTDETFGMIGEKEFEMAKKGVRVVNCARGGIIDEDALAKALEKGIVASAGIDVLVGEPNPDSPLVDFENVILTPHLGADTYEAQDNVGVTVAKEVMNALKGEMVPNAVNLPALKHHDLENIKPYLFLGETLGKFYHQVRKDSINKVEIHYSGNVTNYETSVITLSVLKGLFEPILREQVNYVNASVTAQNRGIEVVESKGQDAGNLLNLIKVVVHSKEKVFTISGTVSGKGQERIVEINDYELDFTPTQYMIVVKNNDRPGVIGQVGTLLGVHKTNIATMQVSRNSKGGRALMLLSVDTDVTKEAQQVINNIDGVEKVAFVKI
ncbi:phosphoglycerate dehydrogenase [Serpentinicella sp. ANB-PHB4]|uniref:phosphoglycerate dehydrogenase n=1 Tax=Serpentinicella sp. ANB-PHB4 TaxID=3074076 RepID=UPI0028672BC3|nr:phosphoglycerate dehydrogenase [Serpentinicella sp. ANB-PHB4]MDR5659305.1 phosphoglycerate dehydrogenase [Serpentinicella sp. ANB-PHB4]